MVSTSFQLEPLDQLQYWWGSSGKCKIAWKFDLLFAFSVLLELLTAFFLQDLNYELFQMRKQSTDKKSSLLDLEEGSLCIGRSSLYLLNGLLDSWAAASWMSQFLPLFQFFALYCAAHTKF